MLENRDIHQKKEINNNYNSIINKSIRELNNRGSTIQENYEPYKNCIIFYEYFYKVYLSLLKFLYENSYDNIEESDFYLNIQQLKNKIDKLHYLLVETVTSRIKRNKQNRLEQRLEGEKSEALNASLPPPPPSWTSELNQRDLATMGSISPEQWQKRQNNFEISRAIKLQEISNKGTIQACSTPGISMDPNDCEQAYARQEKRNLNKAEADRKFQVEYFQKHGRQPPNGPYSH